MFPSIFILDKESTPQYKALKIQTALFINCALVSHFYEVEDSGSCLQIYQLNKIRHQKR